MSTLAGILKLVYRFLALGLGDYLWLAEGALQGSYGRRSSTTTSGIGLSYSKTFEHTYNNCSRCSTCDWSPKAIVLSGGLGPVWWWGAVELGLETTE